MCVCVLFVLFWFLCLICFLFVLIITSYLGRGERAYMKLGDQRLVKILEKLGEVEEYD